VMVGRVVLRVTDFGSGRVRGLVEPRDGCLFAGESAVIGATFYCQNSWLDLLLNCRNGKCRIFVGRTAALMPSAGVTLNCNSWSRQLH